MEMSLFKKDGVTWTRFKVSINRFLEWKLICLKIKYGIDTENPVKQNSRFIYFEKEGDFLNGK